MSKKIFKYGAIVLAVLAVIAMALYFYAFTTLKHKTEQQGEVQGFKLFFDGIVIDQFKPDPSIELKTVYLHGMIWELLQNKPEYVSIAEAKVDADHLLNNKINWPFATLLIDIASVKIDKTIFEQKISFAGDAKQTLETPLLLDFTSEDEKIVIAGKAEIRIENNQMQMIDLNFDQADIETPSLTAKRSTGWLSFSYEDGWQVVGEMDAGLTLLGSHELFDSTVKWTGAVAQPEMTFSGQMDQQMILIDQREGAYYLRQQDRTFPIGTTGTPLQEITATMDKVKQIQLAEAEAAKIEQEKQAAEALKKQIKKIATKKEVPPPVAIKIEPIKLPEIKLADITPNTSLAGFVYDQPLVQVVQPCQNGKCWVAHGQGGQFTYSPEVLPNYFLQLKDYEQVKQLKAALLDFNVQSITINGKDKTAQKILLKGTTVENQPAEIQLVVLGLE